MKIKCFGKNRSVQLCDTLLRDRMSQSRSETVLYIRDLCKKYEDGPPVLQNLCMSVNKGELYSLLGSSGSGKTTLVDLILNIQERNSGELLVFGKDSCRDKSFIRNLVGYMPQDLRLYSQLTAYESVQFFARLHGVSQTDLKEKWKFLVKLLQISYGNLLISQMSGGQRRRVSLAVAFIHSPHLLLLDEPTVGLDPLLRQSVWEYLREITRTRKTTIVITTHYIEETRQSDKIGILRSGRLIAEDTPNALLQRFNCTLIEEVVLLLCKKDDSPTHVEAKICDEKCTSLIPYASPVCVANVSKFNGTFQRIYAYVSIIAISLLRYHVFFLALLCMPCFNCGLCVLSIGSGMVQDLPFAIVNQETETCSQQFNKRDHTCDFSFVSCAFTNHLQKDGFLKLYYFETELLALSSVRNGESWGYIKIPENYSEHLQQFSLTRHFASNETIVGNQITARIDSSQSVTGYFLTKHLFQSYQNFIGQLALSCNVSQAEVDLPLKFREPVYGSEIDSFTDYQLPGGIILTLFSMVGSLTGLIFINDFKQGTLGRARVAGLSMLDMIAGIYIIMTIICLIQTLIMTAVLVVGFNVTMNGSFWIYFLLCWLSGVWSTSFGLFVSIVCRDEMSALIVAVFAYPILMLMSGAIFPMEGIFWFWRQIGYLLPTTLPIVSLRSVMVRGLGLQSLLVWPGVLAFLIWTVIFTLCSVIAFKKLKL